MSTFTSTISNIKTAKILFGLSLLVFAFYLVGYFIIGDVYRYAIVGSIYEILWLPMLLSLVAIPLVSLLVFIKNKGKHRVYAVLALLFIIGSSFILINH